MTDKQEWMYNFESNWPIQCEQPHQSPVNIDTSILVACNELCHLKIKYKPLNLCTVSFYKNKNLTIDYDNGSFIIYKDNYYLLKQITFHTPSLHTINNKKYDLEVCFIHSNRDDGKDGLIISCLYNEGNFYGNEEIFVNQFLNQIQENTKQEIDVGSNWNANLMIPKEKSFYIYEGSLPFPPCTENMTYLVFDTIGNIGPINLDILRNNLSKNARNLVPINNRTIFYSSGVKTEANKVKISDNKYFRCKPKKDIETTKKPEPKIPELPEDSRASFKNSIKNLFVVVFVLLLIVIAFRTAKVFIQQGTAQKFVGLFVDNSITGDTKITQIWNSRCKQIY